MRRILLNSARHAYSCQTFKSNSNKSLLLPLPSTHSNFKSFSTHNPNPRSRSTVVEDVSNEDFKAMINKYLEEDGEEMVPSLLEAILKRKLSRNHDETDDEILDEIDKNKKLDDGKDDKKKGLDDGEVVGFDSGSEEGDDDF